MCSRSEKLNWCINEWSKMSWNYLHRQSWGLISLVLGGSHGIEGPLRFSHYKFCSSPWGSQRAWSGNSELLFMKSNFKWTDHVERLHWKNSLPSSPRNVLNLRVKTSQMPNETADWCLMKFNSGTSKLWPSWILGLKKQEFY